MITHEESQEIIKTLVIALSEILDDLSPTYPFNWTPGTGVSIDVWDQAIIALEKAEWIND